MSLTIAETAVAYAKRGWKPVPVNRKSKKAIGKEWQKRPFDPRQFNGNEQNIGVQFGAVSRGLCDVDLDSMTAIGFAPEFLPADVPSRARTNSTSPTSTRASTRPISPFPNTMPQAWPGR